MQKRSTIRIFPSPGAKIEFKASKERRSIIIRLCARALSHFNSSFSSRHDARSPIDSLWPMPLPSLSSLVSSRLVPFFSSLGTKPCNDRERKSRRRLLACYENARRYNRRKQEANRIRVRRERKRRGKKETQRGRELS